VGGAYESVASVPVDTPTTVDTDTGRFPPVPGGMIRCSFSLDSQMTTGDDCYPMVAPITSEGELPKFLPSSRTAPSSSGDTGRSFMDTMPEMLAAASRSNPTLPFVGTPDYGLTRTMDGGGKNENMFSFAVACPLTSTEPSPLCQGGYRPTQ